MIVVAGATAAQALLIEPALDELVVKGNVALLWLIPGGFFCAAVIKGFSNYFQTVFMQKVGLRMIVMMQNQMFVHIISADLAHIQCEATGKQMTRFTNDVQVMRDATVKAFTGIARDMITVVALAGVMIYTNWQMALIAMVVMPVSVFPIVYIGKRLRRVSARTQESIGSVASYLDDVLKAARQVKSYVTEDHEKRRAHQFFVEVSENFLKAGKTRARTSPILESLFGAGIAAVLAWGGYQAMSDQITVGQLMGFFAAAAAGYQPIRGLANLNASLQLGLAAADRVFAVLDYQPKIFSKPDAKPLDVREGAVKFENIGFSYDGNKSALAELTIEFDPGKTTALVGPSGAGKSTILNLIPRFYDPSIGRIVIDGQAIEDVNLASLRHAIAFVSQEITMFNDTVRANIAYGRLEAMDNEIIEAAKSAAAHEFIEDLPNGYDTMVGESGLRLSGGQRQRISIARAMLKNAPILLLDEATSALDSESERQVHDALKRLMVGRTTIVIAHRLSTVSDADKIYVMKNGRVVEEGTHLELLDRDGLYAQYCKLQFEDGQKLNSSLAVANE
tara:strand:- start:10350 stop:12038 length:1689 start_codon:yes stop_codon:yes gene_type:complete